MLETVYHFVRIKIDIRSFPDHSPDFFPPFVRFRQKKSVAKQVARILFPLMLYSPFAFLSASQIYHHPFFSTLVLSIAFRMRPVKITICTAVTYFITASSMAPSSQHSPLFRMFSFHFTETIILYISISLLTKIHGSQFFLMLISGLFFLITKDRKYRKTA